MDTDIDDLVSKSMAATQSLVQRVQQGSGALDQLDDTVTATEQKIQAAGSLAQQALTQLQAQMTAVSEQWTAERKRFQGALQQAQQLIATLQSPVDGALQDDLKQIATLSAKLTLVQTEANTQAAAVEQLMADLQSKLAAGLAALEDQDKKLETAVGLYQGAAAALQSDLTKQLATLTGSYTALQAGLTTLVGDVQQALLNCATQADGQLSQLEDLAAKAVTSTDQQVHDVIAATLGVHLRTVAAQYAAELSQIQTLLAGAGGFSDVLTQQTQDLVNGLNQTMRPGVATISGNLYQSACDVNLADRSLNVPSLN